MLSQLGPLLQQMLQAAAHKMGLTGRYPPPPIPYLPQPGLPLQLPTTTPLAVVSLQECVCWLPPPALIYWTLLCCAPAA